MHVSLEFRQNETKENVFSQVESFLTLNNLKIESVDNERPWGGFFVIDESMAGRFITNFFPTFDISDFRGYDKLSPKILIVQPEKRLSWQYHNRRAELWKVIGGSAGVIVSDTDEQGDVQVLGKGDHISMRQGQRHRLVGLNEWAVIAEIWKHTNLEHPSDEEDIVRVEDDFGR